MSVIHAGRNAFAGDWWWSKNGNWTKYLVICGSDLDRRGFVASFIRDAVVDDFGDLIAVPRG